jgi:hypothetical protein
MKFIPVQDLFHIIIDSFPHRFFGRRGSIKGRIEIGTLRGSNWNIEKEQLEH